MPFLASGLLPPVGSNPPIDSDPCELQFLDYREGQGVSMPGRLIARYGDAFEWDMSVDQYGMDEGAE